MTVKDVLLISPWNVKYSGDENWERFINDVVGKWYCMPTATIRTDLNYYELCKKNQGVIRVFQNGNCCEFLDMDPCENALIVHFSGLPLALAEIYEYRQKPFEEVIILHNIRFLANHFEDFNIFTESGKPITERYTVQHCDENLVAISKKTLNFEGPFQDGSENRNIHIVMRYISPTVACDIKNKQ